MSFKDNVKKSSKKSSKSKAHPGFKGAVENVKKGGKYSDKEAAAIVAAASRNASAAAKAKNPNLKKVK